MANKNKSQPCILQEPCNTVTNFPALEIGRLSLHSSSKFRINQPPNYIFLSQLLNFTQPKFHILAYFLGDQSFFALKIT
jgi:hypothetical protein